MGSPIILTKGRKLRPAEEFDLPTIVIPEKIIKETQKGLLSFFKGEAPNKGIVYWAGKEEKKGLRVVEVIVPRALATPVSFRVEALENSRIITLLQKEGLILIAQVHSHPPGADLNHDLSEEEMGFQPYEGLFSLVVGDYGLAGLLPLVDQGIHLFHRGDFVRLSREQIEKYFKVVSSP